MFKDKEIEFIAAMITEVADRNGFGCVLYLWDGKKVASVINGNPQYVELAIKRLMRQYKSDCWE